MWQERRRILPGTAHPALQAILERRQMSEEDLILLASAVVGQFRTADEIIKDASDQAARAGVTGFDALAAAQQLVRPRRDLYAAVDKRTEGFARCNIPLIDEWVDQFRLEHRISPARILVVLSVPAESWHAPPKQAYVAALLDFFSKRVSSAVQRGPLTRMTIGKTTPRIDLAELSSELRSGTALLNHLLLRTEQVVDIDPMVFHMAPSLERRTRALHTHATVYRRDTGIDGLYLGFPFLLSQDARGTTRPRIAPVLLWPASLKPEVGARGRVLIGFDRDREEVRLNPAFESLLGPEIIKRWREAAN